MRKQAAFKTNPIRLEELLRHCGGGKIQLPDVQPSRVWDEERIKGLSASISQAFPVGALMTLEVKPRAADTFAWRPIQAADTSATSAPDQFLRDGQQRMTSLYQTGHPGLKAGIAPEEGRDIPQDDEGFDLPDAQAEEAA